MKTFNKTGMVLALITLFTTLSTTGTALAADGKDYAGAHCMPDSSDPAFVVTHSGAIMNPSGTKNLTVICPGVNDQGTPLTGAVTVYDANPNAPVSCVLENRARGAVNVIGKSTRRTPIVWEGVTTLNFNEPVANQGNAYFYYRCVLPPASQNPLRFSQIFSYEFDEQ